MTSGPSQRPVSALRARMIEDMTVRGFNEHIDPAPFVDDPRHHRLDRLVIADIEFDP